MFYKSEDAFMVVRRMSPLKNHGGVYCHGTKLYIEEDGQLRTARTFGRAFVCECGEPMRDGDPYAGEIQDATGQIVHVNCREKFLAKR